MESKGEAAFLNSEPKIDGRPSIACRVIDPAAFRQDGGPSIVERMSRPPYRLFFRPADNSRIGRRGAMGGWDQVRQCLKGSFGTPSIYFFETCVDAIRTLPFAQHDPARPEDLLLQEDHALDEIRYACLSRPYSTEHEYAEPRRFPAQGLADGQIMLHDVDDLADLADERPNKIARFIIEGFECASRLERTRRARTRPKGHENDPVQGNAAVT